ncbi:MAG: carboxypeptidase-like regulatory domain-containing protein, partial [Candidatus Acidiferrum sp.]
MFKRSSIVAFLVLGFVLAFGAGQARGQASGTIEGVVKDPSGAVVANATVEISDPVSGYDRATTTASDGTFRFTNVPFNSYHMVVTATGFAAYTEDANVRSTVPATSAITLKVGGATTSVTVEANGGDLVENDPTTHTDVDRDLFQKVPL